MLKPDNSEESACFRCNQASRKGGYDTLNRVFCKTHEDHDKFHNKKLKRRRMCDDSEEDDLDVDLS